MSPRRLAVLFAVLCSLVAPSTAFADTPSDVSTVPVQNYQAVEQPAPMTARDFFLKRVPEVSSMDWTAASYSGGTSSGTGVSTIGQTSTTAETSARKVAAGSPLLLRTSDGFTAQPGMTLLGQKGQTLWYGGVTAQKQFGSQISIATCYWEVYTATPSPTLGIRFGTTFSCNQPWVRGAIAAGLGEMVNQQGQPALRSLTHTSAKNVSDGWYAWKSQAAEAPYFRESDLQTEAIWAYLDLYIDNAGPNDGFHWAGGGGAQSSFNCKQQNGQYGPLTPRMFCEAVTTPFPFVPDYPNTNCVTGPLCSTAKYYTQDYPAYLANWANGEMNTYRDLVLSEAARWGNYAGLLVKQTQETINATLADAEADVNKAISDTMDAAEQDLNAIQKDFELRFADVTGDGSADALERNRRIGEVRVSIADGQGGFAQASVWGAWPAERTFRTGDVDGDGREDLVGYVENSGETYWARAGDAAFGPSQGFGTVGSNRSVAFGDINGDSATDAATLATDSGEVTLAISSDGALVGESPVGVIESASELHLGDVDGDGASDIVALNPNNGAIIVRLTDEDGLAPASVWGSGVPKGSVFGLADLDRDDRSDVVFRGPDTDEVRWQSSNGSAFEASQHLGQFSQTHSLMVSDVTNDGSADLVGRAAMNQPFTVLITDIARRWVEDAPFVADPALQYDDGSAVDAGVAVGAASATSAAADSPAACRLAKAGVPRGSNPSLGWADDPVLTHQDSSIRSKGIQRIIEAGGNRARIVLLQNAWMNDVSGLRARTRAAVEELVGCGVRPHVVLTGAEYDVRAPEVPAPSNMPTGTGDFAAFVTSAVGALSETGVTDFAMWNEPNLPMFLRHKCSNGHYRTTSDLYRDLYDAGRAAAIAAKADGMSLRIYAGELSELPHRAGRRLAPGPVVKQDPRGNPVAIYSTCSSSRPMTKSLDTTAYLSRVARAKTAALITSGVAWHPYQHRERPTRVESGIVGIGRTSTMLRAISGLKADLKTASGTVPGLFMTEFGYFNQPQTSDRRSRVPTARAYATWHTEAERTAWTAEALSVAKERGARTLMFWLLTEGEPGTGFDTGMLGGPRPILGRTPTFEGRGKRSYGKPNDPKNPTWSLNNPQGRSAYCDGVRAWAAQQKDQTGNGPAYTVPDRAGDLLPSPC